MLDNAAYSAYYAETRKKLLGLGPDPKGKGKAKMRQAPGDGQPGSSNCKIDFVPVLIYSSTSRCRYPPRNKDPALPQLQSHPSPILRHSP